MNSVCAGAVDFLIEYWYILIVVIMIIISSIVALMAGMNKALKQLRENAEVAQGRMQDREELKKKQAEKERRIEARNKEQEIFSFKKHSEHDGEPFPFLTEEAAVTERESDADVYSKGQQPPQNAQNTALWSDDNTEDDMKKEATKPETTENAEVVGKTTKAIYRVIYDKENKEWMVKKDGATRVIRRVRTKAEALELATQFAENQDLSISVQKKDGKFQKKSNYTKMKAPEKGDKEDKK